MGAAAGVVRIMWRLSRQQRIRHSLRFFAEPVRCALLLDYCCITACYCSITNWHKSVKSISNAEITVHAGQLAPWFTAGDNTRSLGLTQSGAGLSADVCSPPAGLRLSAIQRQVQFQSRLSPHSPQCRHATDARPPWGGKALQGVHRVLSACTRPTTAPRFSYPPTWHAGRGACRASQPARPSARNQARNQACNQARSKRARSKRALNRPHRLM